MLLWADRRAHGTAWPRTSEGALAPLPLPPYTCPYTHLFPISFNHSQVRRPGVLDSVSLDLYLMRGVAQQLRNVPEVRVCVR